MKYRLGLDIGIASCGWAVVRHDADGKPSGIEDLGVRLFEKAEKPDNGESLALARRIARGARRRIRRHQHRKLRAKYLFETYGLMTNAEIEKMYAKQLSDIYDIRVQALERCLNREEWVRLLMLWLQRRGYKSNSKSEKLDNDSGKALKAIDENKKLMTEKGYRTAGEMLAKDEKFRLYEIRKTRNTSGDYKFTLSRHLIESEINFVFEKQRLFKNEFTSEDFKKKYLDIFSSQRRYDRGPAFPSKYGGDLIEKMLGRCTFEKEEQRAPIASYTFEYFRILQDINNISIVSKGGEKTKLEKEDRDGLLKECKKSAEISYKKVRELLKPKLGEDFYFGNLGYGEKDKKEIEGKEKLKGMKAYHEIRLAVNKVEKGAISDFSIDQVDKIAEILTIRKDDFERIELLKKADIPEIYYDALCGLNFTKVGNLSIKAIKNINKHLEQGNTYDKACELAGYDFRNLGKSEKNKKLDINKILQDYDIRNPVVKRAISQALKLLNAIVEKYGLPDLVCIELSRDMSNNYDKRREIEKAQEENRAKNERAYNRVKEFKIKPSGEDIVKFKLWEEQQGVCMYCGKPMIIERLFEDGYAEVDHIIPYSKSFDDSFSNKILVFSKENQNKGNKLPLEYMKSDIAKRDNFIVRVNSTIKNYSKRIKLLKEKLTDADVNKFKERNLNDTRYATKLISTIIRANLLFDEKSIYSKKPVRSVNGSMTAYIRKRFGLEKNRELSSRHHALDAVVVACTTESYIKVITRFNQAVESIYDGESKLIDYDTGEVFKKEDYIKDRINDLQLPPPWDRFREEVNARLSNDPATELEKLKMPTVNEYDNKIIRPIFISYKPNRKITGEAHKATILSGREDGYVIKKVTLDKLKLKEGEIVNYYNKEKDPVLYKLLRDKLKAAQSEEKDKDRIIKGEVFKPKKDKSNGPIVYSVKTIERSSANVSVREGGIAGNGDMVRIDIFYIKDKGYYFVPIYVHNTIEDKLPNMAAPFKYERIMNDKDFLFSIYYNDLIYFESKTKQTFVKTLKNAKGDGEEYDKGYFYYKTADITNGTITLNTDHNNMKTRIYINGLKVLKKCEVDLLGNISFVKENGVRKAFNLKNKKR